MCWFRSKRLAVKVLKYNVLCKCVYICIHTHIISHISLIKEVSEVMAREQVPDAGTNNQTAQSSLKK